MKTRIATLFLVVGMMLSAFVADARPARPTDASAAFDRLKGLVGTWQVESNMGQFKVTYELVSDGNVLLERGHNNMVTTYYLDGDTLVLTHYCELGNEPHMVARRIDLERGEIAFDFAGAGNLADPGAKHMHSVVFRLADADHFSTAWTLFENSQPNLTVTAQAVRVK